MYAAAWAGASETITPLIGPGERTNCKDSCNKWNRLIIKIFMILETVVITVTNFAVIFGFVQSWNSDCDSIFPITLNWVGFIFSITIAFHILINVYYLYKTFTPEVSETPRIIDLQTFVLVIQSIINCIFAFAMLGNYYSNTGTNIACENLLDIIFIQTWIFLFYFGCMICLITVDKATQTKSDEFNLGHTTL